MNLDLRHLELVVAIVEQGGVTKASERLHLSQSALSCQLKEAERRLGTALFHRTGRQMLLTAAGERLLRTALCVLRELTTAEQEIRALQSAPPAPVRIATECFTCYAWLPAVIHRLQERVPSLDITIAAEHTRNPGAAILKGDLDVAVVTRGDPRRRLHLTPLFVDQMIAAVPLGHRLASRKWIDAADLTQEHVVTFDARREELTLFTDLMDPAGLEPRKHTRMQLTEAMFELVKAGIAIAIMPRWVVLGNAAMTQMKLVQLTRKGIHRRWSAATLRGRKVPPHIPTFVEILSSQIRRTVELTAG